MNQEQSNKQYDEVIASCKAEFIEKNKKYGNSLNPYDANGVLSKVFIKLYRIKSIQEVGTYLVEGESIDKEIPGVINYCLYGLVVARQIVSGIHICYEEETLYKEYDISTQTTRKLFQKKNHDYGEAWRDLSISYMTQECLVKFTRMKNLYQKLKFNKEKQLQLQEEFIEVFSDICNYQIFCAILISEGVNPMI